MAYILKTIMYCFIFSVCGEMVQAARESPILLQRKGPSKYQSSLIMVVVRHRQIKLFIILCVFEGRKKLI